MIGHPNATAYAASKAGLIALAKGLGRELGPQGIAVNAVCPGTVDTDLINRDATFEKRSACEKRLAKHRKGRYSPYTY